MVITHNTLVVGLTRHGKTYGVVQRLKKSKRPALFIKPGKPLKAGFSVADRRNTVDQIIKALKNGCKIEYRMGNVSKDNVGEMIYLVNKIINAGFKENNPINLAIDEVNFLSRYKDGRETLEMLAQMGIQHGLNTFFISQRFANIPYTVMAQCREIDFYKLGPLEKEYVERKKFDFDYIQNSISKNGMYSYMVFDNEKGLSGPFKE